MRERLPLPARELVLTLEPVQADVYTVIRVSQTQRSMLAGWLSNSSRDVRKLNQIHKDRHTLVRVLRVTVIRSSERRRMVFGQIRGL